MDEWARNVDDPARRRAYVCMLLPELLNIVSEDGGDDQTAAAQETKPTWPTDEPRPTPPTEAEMLIEIGSLREQLIAARKSEWGAHQTYRELELFHGGGPLTMTIDDDDEPTDHAAGAAA